MYVVTYRKLFYTLSGILVIASLVAIFAWGFNLGIDFKGGSLLEIDYPQGRPAQTEIVTTIAPLNVDASVRPTGDAGYIIRMKDLNQDEKTSLLTKLGSFGSTTIKQFDSIGPVLGSEALRKALFSIVLVIIAIVLFIAYAFRKVSEPISSWKYGIVAIIALAHDVIIPTGVFVALGHFAGYEIDTLFITALLVVLGFSVHDTIVVFDRVRENLGHASAKKPFDQIVGESISQTFTRSINTSLTTLLALIVLYFVGGESTQHFSLALIIGIAAGTYSSIFIGSPLLVTLEKWQNKKGKK
jgi:preprotein translocase subunit SecF